MGVTRVISPTPGNESLPAARMLLLVLPTLLCGDAGEKGVGAGDCPSAGGERLVDVPEGLRLEQGRLVDAEQVEAHPAKKQAAVAPRAPGQNQKGKHDSVG